MNIIIYSSQCFFHKMTKAKIISYNMSMLTKVSNLLSLSPSTVRCTERKFRIKNWTKEETFVEELISCGSINERILNVKEVLTKAKSKANKQAY